jgi:hypothetical protein
LLIATNQDITDTHHLLIDGQHSTDSLVLRSADEAGAGLTHEDAAADERSKQRPGHTAAAIHPTRQGCAKVSMEVAAITELSRFLSLTADAGAVLSSAQRHLHFMYHPHRSDSMYSNMHVSETHTL